MFLKRTIMLLLLISHVPYTTGVQPELQLNEANTSDTEPPFLDLYLSISNGFVSSKIHDKRDDFDFDIVNFPFLDGDVPRRPSYGVYEGLSRSSLTNVKKLTIII